MYSEEWLECWHLNWNGCWFDTRVAYFPQPTQLVGMDTWVLGGLGKGKGKMGTTLTQTILWETPHSLKNLKKGHGMTFTFVYSEKPGLPDNDSLNTN